MKKKRKTKIPRTLGAVMRFLERRGLSVYGPNYQPPSSIMCGCRDFDAKLVRQYIAEQDRGTLQEDYES